jgi:hypothetical protein
MDPLVMEVVEEELVLDRLDFPLLCEWAEGEAGAPAPHPAELAVLCKRCRLSALICWMHFLQENRRSEALHASKPSFRVICKRCGAAAPTVDALVDKVPL